MTHRGRPGEHDEELTGLELRFEESAGDPLTSAEANALIENLHVYRDTGSGVFEAGSDTLVITAGTLTLDGTGTMTVPVPDGDASVRVVQGTPTTFFVALELTADAMPRLRTMKDLEEFWIEINRLENSGDKSYRRILAKLFSGKYEALEVLKLKDIVDSLEAAIDAFEKVANTVEQIAVKES